MDKRYYSPADIEAAVQDRWQKTQAFHVVEDPVRVKYYCLSMFPYPSGRLHMGHVRNYTIGDVLARYHRMCGRNVLQPMGWDAFGLPAENAAMQNGVPPAQWTYENIKDMKEQLKKLGFAIDWSREIATCSPGYYRWNQWLFLRMLENGVAYKKTQVVNWDPVDQTVLANEQVIDGRGWRTGAIVERREIPGYYLRITRYAEELLADLDKLPGWPERVRTMQANWIGKSYGVRFAFPYKLPADSAPASASPASAGEGEGLLWVFTTRADTIMGVTFCAVAAEHPLATYAAKRNPKLAAFVDECKRGTVMEADLATIEKKGMPTGVFVTHPLTGAQIEVWVGNYVLMGYGEGAVMAVPAHDERDFHFAEKYGLPIKQVIEIPGRKFSADAWQDWYGDKENGRCVNSGTYDGLTYEQAVDAIAADLKRKGLGEKQLQWRLRDWGISRQRYWGCPIPIIHCMACGDVPVPDSELPVVLPEDCVPDGTGNPLARREDFLRYTCPRCGDPARRETDTMDTFVDSSWYYARYCCADNEAAMVDERAHYWMPVDQYIGGIEHAILHLLYSRFWSKVMRDVGLVRYDEPFARLLTQGMVLNHIFSRRTGKGGVSYFAPEEVEVRVDQDGRIVGATALCDGLVVNYDGVGTMSKSKRNGVDPQALIERYGADTARFFVIFTSPPEQTLEWSDAGVEGAYRFLKRLWNFCLRLSEELEQAGGMAAIGPVDETILSREQANTRRAIHLALKQSNFDLERQQFNTVASGAMKILNALDDAALAMFLFSPSEERAKSRGYLARNAIYKEGLSILLRLLSPITPHVCDHLWRELGFGEDILNAQWPEPEERALQQDEVELVLQINGKLRGNIRVDVDASKEQIEWAAINSEVGHKYISDPNQVKKVVVVPGRLVNIVVG
ncbi:MAG: leucine--tRNA ligase [Chromatiales bacterium]